MLKMSAGQLLRAVISERLTAAVEEIFQVFDKTIVKYEEEVSSSKQEIERLRALLQEFASQQKTDCSHSSPIKDERQELSLSVHQEAPELQHVKEEEDRELWASEQQDEEFKECKDAADEPHIPQSPVWEGDKKNSLRPRTQNGECHGQFQEPQGAESAQLFLPLASTSLMLIPDVRENERPAETFTNQTQADRSLSSFTTSSESTTSLHLNCVTLGLKRCHVCGKHCNSMSALAEHMTCHTKVKRHRCHVCGKECGRKGDLKIHMRIHTGEKPFCCSHCHKRFTNSGHLRKHIRTHTGERPHRCDVCGRGFLQSVHLKHHLGTHIQKN